jgi:hypothetical protein
LVIFRLFETNLVKTNRRKFNALLTSRPSGFLNSIRVLQISRGYDNNALLRLLSVLPRDRLIELRCVAWIERNTLGVFLRNQTKLNALFAPTQNGQRLCNPPNESYVTGSLQQLEELTLFVHGDGEQGYKEYLAWFRHLPQLKHLTIRSSSNQSSPLSGWTVSIGTVRVRWVDHKCKVNSDEFDEEATLCSW